MQYFSSKEKLALARSLFTKTSPTYVQFYITARCNLSCEQCNIIYAHADTNEMTIDQIRAMADNLADIGVCIVLLIGGEPFVRKDIAEIVQAFTRVGIHVRLQTNGLATKQQLEACVQAGAHDISISLDSLEPNLQDSINGRYPNSWSSAINTVATVNEVFTENATAFFGTVLMPRNIFHIRDVIEFATEIGWGVSLVPAHISTPDRPQGFRSFDDTGVCRFSQESYPYIRRVLEEVKVLRNSGLNVYDSDEYLDDIYRFVAGQPLQWRRRNHDVCDSPNLYFAVEPNGNISPCCDFKLDNSYPLYHKDFTKWYRAGLIHKEVYSFTHNCAGCMYGSYPEITISARYLKPMVRRFFYFNHKTACLPRIPAHEMKQIAARTYERNQGRRQTLDKALSESLEKTSDA